jgi:hypothetical protein
VIERNEAARAAVAKDEAEFRTREALLERHAEVLTIYLRYGEKLAGTVLQRHSTRTKIAMSELVVQTVEDLRSPDVRPKDRALALASLKAVCDRLYGWDREPDLHELKVAQTAAINLELQDTSPEKLKQLALAKAGLLSPEHDGQGMGPCQVRPEHTSAGVDGPLGEKGVPEKLAQKIARTPDPLAIQPTQKGGTFPSWNGTRFSRLRPSPNHYPEVPRIRTPRRVRLSRQPNSGS